MKKNTVVIKSCAYGLNIILDPAISFEQLLKDTADKFREAARFFGNAQMAVSFRGRALSSDEELRLIETIVANSRIEIVFAGRTDQDHLIACLRQALISIA